ncbi:MAG: EscU/YscU/HrcU family type III secretion system export apparatus switch protein [Firmicutes bacterium]|nr:EscU/YscU/HrcU family type III secretion system export apparatus switch protein [Bacillota bacterium]
MAEEKKKIDIHQKAVALRYKFGDVAPNVVAKGQGYVAQKILENAQSSDIPVYRDSKLVEELSNVNLGDNIPPELYEVVAQVLVFISDLDKMEEMKRYAAKQ